MSSRLDVPYMGSGGGWEKEEGMGGRIDDPSNGPGCRWEKEVGRSRLSRSDVSLT
jgi:hypothetical protein